MGCKLIYVETEDTSRDLDRCGDLQETIQKLKNENDFLREGIGYLSHKFIEQKLVNTLYKDIL